MNNPTNRQMIRHKWFTNTHTCCTSMISTYGANKLSLAVNDIWNKQVFKLCQQVCKRINMQDEMQCKYFLTPSFLHFKQSCTAVNRNVSASTNKVTKEVWNSIQFCCLLLCSALRTLISYLFLIIYFLLKRMAFFPCSFLNTPLIVRI